MAFEQGERPGTFLTVWTSNSSSPASFVFFCSFSLQSPNPPRSGTTAPGG